MKSYSIIEYFDIFKYFTFSLLYCFKVALVHQFSFQSMEKTLRYCVTLNSSLCGSYFVWSRVVSRFFSDCLRRTDVLNRYARLILYRVCVSRSPWVSHYWPTWLAFVYPLTSNNPPGIQLNHHGQIQPTFLSLNTGDVAGKVLIRLLNMKLSC